jgi:nicotinate-nucleotide pyrophosphorylase (carboxylating)
MSSLPPDIPAQVARSLVEDVGSGDVTAALIDAATQATATVISREPAIICGQAWFAETFRQLDADIHIQWLVDEGELVAGNTLLCELSGSARALLTGERTALNFLQTLSGTATITQRYAHAVEGTGCRILDTRKTLPGLRLAQKYAVRCGGGDNHRLGLYDRVLLKENHIMAAGSVAIAVQRAREQSPQVPIEVEVESLDEFVAALEAGPDIIMLDELDDVQMRNAVAVNRAAARPVKLEASGGVDLETVRRIAATGVDYVSVGSLTKHLRAVDMSLRFKLRPPL